MYIIQLVYVKICLRNLRIREVSVRQIRGLKIFLVLREDVWRVADRVLGDLNNHNLSVYFTLESTWARSFTEFHSLVQLTLVLITYAKGITLLLAVRNV